MLTWFFLAVLAIATGGVLAYRVGKRRGETALPPGGGTQELPGRTAALLERTIADVRVDDVVQADGRDWLVEGVVRYEEDGHTWRGARVMDGNEEGWLLIGLDRGAGVTIRLLRPARGVELSSYPPDSLSVDNQHFKLVKRGTATALFEGQLGSLPVKGLAGGASLRCRWWRYQAAGERCLIVEQWGDAYRALAGETVSPEKIELLAAS